MVLEPSLLPTDVRDRSYNQGKLRCMMYSHVTVAWIQTEPSRDGQRHLWRTGEQWRKPWGTSKKTVRIYVCPRPSPHIWYIKVPYVLTQPNICLSENSVPPKCDGLSQFSPWKLQAGGVSPIFRHIQIQHIVGNNRVYHIISSLWLLKTPSLRITHYITTDHQKWWDSHSNKKSSWKMWPTLGDDPQNPNHNLHEDHHVGPRAEAPELSTFGHQYGGREGNVSHIWRFTRKWVMSMNTCDSWLMRKQQN